MPELLNEHDRPATTASPPPHRPFLDIAAEQAIIEADTLTLLETR